MKKADKGKHWNLSSETKKRISESMKLLRKTVPPSNKTHGLSKSRIYRIWHGMKARINCPKEQDRKNYLARGINYDSNWEKFENFRKDMGKSYKDNLQLDRIDNDKGYSKENCRWVTPREQQNNCRDNNYYEFMGISDTLPNWARFFGFNKSTLESRVYQAKWSINRALTERNPYYA